jgi:DNA polymerase III delta prime subunit
MTEIAGHQWIIHSMEYFIKTGTLPHVILHGPSGSGKTTIVKCYITQMYGDASEFLSFILNASSERGIDTIRTLVKAFADSDVNAFLEEAQRKPYKLVILDEVDSMTTKAQNMLCQIMDRSCGSTRFFMMCNEIEKICPVVQSRCAVYRFPPLNADAVQVIVDRIVETEQLQITKKAIQACISISQGDMRTTINLLQQASTTFPDRITHDHIYQLSGQANTAHLIQAHAMLIELIAYRGESQRAASSKSRKLLACIKYINEQLTENHVTIPGILNVLRQYLWKSDLPDLQKAKLISHLARMELCDSDSVSEDLIVISLVSGYIVLSQEDADENSSSK